MKQRILTGDRPSGKLHLGHYVGSLRNRVALQDECDEYILVADIQALTDNFHQPERVRENITEVVLDYLSVGIDPERATIVLQSQVPEIAELAILLMNLVRVSRLQRNPTVKAEIVQRGMADNNATVGFMVYPVHQAADILSFAADLVPVGNDQLPMIEQARELVIKFNHIYGETLVMPQAKLSEYPRLPGTDGSSKMGKSLGNVINLSDSAQEVRRKVMGMYTDPNRKHATDPGKVEGNPLFVYHDAFNPNIGEVTDFKERYVQGRVGDVEVKTSLVAVLNEMLEPFRDRRAYAQSQHGLVRDVLEAGTKKARLVTCDVMGKVREAMRIDFFRR